MLTTADSPCVRRFYATVGIESYVVQVKKEAEQQVLAHAAKLSFALAVNLTIIALSFWQLTLRSRMLSYLWLLQLVILQLKLPQPTLRNSCYKLILRGHGTVDDRRLYGAGNSSLIADTTGQAWYLWLLLLVIR